MKECYTREELIQSVASGEQVEYLFFWGHTEKDQLTKACFSQWYPAEFEVDGVAYKTAEHYMMAGKARLFEDQEILEKILIASSPIEAKKLGRAVKNFDPEKWNEKGFEIVVEASVAKFSQDPALKEFLLNTGDKVLVEAAPRDRIWGIGLGQNNEKAQNPETWRGRNLLGFALMKARSIIREQN